MNLNRKTLPRILSHLWASLRGNGLTKKYAVCEPPLRSELFSSDQMEQHGRTLAGLHKLSPGYSPDQLLARLAENEGILTGTRRLLMEAVMTDRRIAPAGEWLLDNFYLIEEQIRTAKRHLPKGYSRELPRLLNGPSAGLPRVYDIALETISHGDGRVDPKSLSRFVAAYQTVTGLKLGELWAIPIMLRLALIENLRRVGADLTRRWTGGSGKPQQLRRRLPDGGRSDAGRIVGHPDHAAPGADRESPARWNPDRRRPDGPEPRRLLGGPYDGDRRKGPEEPDPCDRGYGAVRAADGGSVCGGTCAPVAGARPRFGAAAHLD